MKIERLPLPDVGQPRVAGLAGERGLVWALVISVLVWLLAWYWETAYSMIATWRRSETFAHGFLVVPISLWLIWRRRSFVEGLDLRPDFSALPVLAVLGVAWLLGELAGVATVQQFALVLMIPVMAWALLGRSLVKSLAFPFSFLLFAVPFGAFLEPILMLHTADFTVFALRLTGIPVFREGQQFTIPSGSWSVVEACSGLRYLIASLTVGVLYAYLTYRSPLRRAVFIAASVVVPIIGNWLRAYMIVMIGHLTEMKYAVGFDHLIYGWLFFGLIMAFLFWAGSFWREDLDDEAAPAVAIPTRRAPPALATMTVAAVAVAALAAMWPATATHLEGQDAAGPALRAPEPVGGWQRVAGPLTDWTPRFYTAHDAVNQTYGKDDAQVGLYVGYYRNQRPGAQLISSQNQLVSTDNRIWRNAGETRRVLLPGGDLPAIEAKLQGVSSSLLVWQWYWVDGQFVANPYWAKVLQAKSRLLGRSDDGAVVMLYAPYDERRPHAAEKALRDFAIAELTGVTTSLENARRP